MADRRWVLVVLLTVLGSLAAEYRTRNFVVDAATPEVAKHIGDWAEHHRKHKAIEWLGKEMAPWGQPCPLKVKVTYNGSGGATSFAFDRGSILSMEMQIQGTLERLTYSVLPHEVTHTVLAYHYRCPVPRWADEGGSVLSEDDQERQRHDQLVREILRTPGRAIPLKRLFALTQYPRDVMVLYAEGYSVTNFLVGKSDRRSFMAFVGDGMRRGWDVAVNSHYGYRNVDELEQAWMQSLRDGHKMAPTPSAQQLVSASPSARSVQATPTSRVVVRQTLPPAMPILGTPRPIARGTAPDDEENDTPRVVPFKEDGYAAPLPAPASGSAIPRPAASLGVPRPSTGPSWNRPDN